MELEAQAIKIDSKGFTLYKRRWAMLALYLSYVTMIAFQWIQYSIIADVIHHYYDVPYSAVNWTSVVFMIAFVVTIIPATWLNNKIRLRISVLVAMGATTIGSWIKVISVAPDLFWVTFLGQTIVAVSQVYSLSISVPLAAAWFGPEEVSTACSIGLIGPQIGGALGFFIPVILVLDVSVITENTNAEIEKGLNYLFYGSAIISTIIFVLQLIFLRSAPPTPPSNAQALRGQHSASIKEYLWSLWKLMKIPSFVLIFLAYSINIAVFSAIQTFLNQMILPLYPDAQNDAGNIGVLMTLIGLVSSVLVGFILDKTRRYKEVNIIVYALSAAALIAFTFILRTQNLTFLYIISGVFGFIVLGYWPAAFEFAAELTYPEPEEYSAGILTFGCELLAAILTLAYGWVLTPYGDLASNLFMSGALVVGAALTVFAKSDLRRQRAERQNQ